MKNKTMTHVKAVSMLLALILGFGAPVSLSVAGVGNSKLAAKAVNKGGNVLPPEAIVKGYSLTDMAHLGAAFNVSDHSGLVIPIPDEIKSGKPFQGLYVTETNTFNVKPGTMLYVPVMQNDDSYPVIGNFPVDQNQNYLSKEAILDYFYSNDQMGVRDVKIIVDGKETLLNEDYLAWVNVDPLPDGGGTHYMTVAAFLTPLKKGQHTVVISARIIGDAVAPWCEILNDLYQTTVCTTEYDFTIPYIVNVR